MNTDTFRNYLDSAIENYSSRTGNVPGVNTALIDMDGVLYDSMPWHTLAWKQMTDEAGFSVPREDFYLYEGMTGAATLRLIFMKERGEEPSPEEIKRLYARKTELFKGMGKKEKMPGAEEMLAILLEHGIRPVLVTGSGQNSLITALIQDYPGVFTPSLMVTAADVSKGKPDPEPYLMGLEKAGVKPGQAMVVENAPLGVEAGAAAGCFTIGLTTGSVPPEALREAGADLVLPSMRCFAGFLPLIIESLNVTRP